MNYALQADEAVLYKNMIASEKANEEIELVLTNKQILLSITTKRLFAKNEVNYQHYSVADITVYNDIPQITQKGNIVHLFLTRGELTLRFPWPTEAAKFTKLCMQLLTGKTLAERNADKIKGTIGLVDRTLGIDTVGTVKNVLEKGIGGTIVGTLASHKTAKTKGMLGHVANIAQSIAGNQAEIAPTGNSIDDSVEQIKKYKELLDAGILTQEEFDQKKKQLLNI